MAASEGNSLTLSPALPGERPDVFRLLFGHCAPEAQQRRLARALALLEAGELDPAGVFALREGSAVAGALFATVLPGSSGLLWPPQAAGGPRRAAHEDELVRHGVAWLRQRGARVLQCMLAPDEAFLAQPLLRNGFGHITALWYLRHDGDLPPRFLGTPARLAYQTYSSADRDLFHATLLRTYEGTQDCPEVMGLRTAEQIIAGHQAQGKFDPELWWLGLEAGQPAGVLLVTGLTETPGWEVAYVGVVPDARRRGHGRELVLKALLEARAAGVSEVMLTVDGRNRPAWDLYRSLGFEPFDKREVFLLT
jgi:ribosomal protein S18 acetylase RimI-like enzyme